MLKTNMKSSLNDPIDVLDTTGKPTGEVLSKREIHARGKLHRAVHLYLFDRENNLLLQRRSPHVDYYPNRLSISVTGHVDAGETSQAAAQRELREELGIDIDTGQLKFLFSLRQDSTLGSHYIDRQFNDIYVCRFISEIPKIILNPNEVSEVQWVPFTTFEAMVKDPKSELASTYEVECDRVATWLKGVPKSMR